MVISNILAQYSRGIWLMGAFKSQKPTEGPVKIANTKNFTDVVSNSGREALILFYAPWCTHCPKVLHVWDELGDKLKDENVDIVKIDATTNKWPSEYDVDGYPTIYWKYAEKSMEPVKYNGGRSLQDFIDYVSKKSKVELAGFDRRGMRKRSL